jgi:hypothetical protein
MEQVAGIDPALLAWRPSGYSQGWLIIFNMSNLKPNMNCHFIRLLYGYSKLSWYLFRTCTNNLSMQHTPSVLYPSVL